MLPGGPPSGLAGIRRMCSVSPIFLGVQFHLHGRHEIKAVFSSAQAPLAFSFWPCSSVQGFVVRCAYRLPAHSCCRHAPEDRGLQSSCRSPIQVKRRSVESARGTLGAAGRLTTSRGVVRGGAGHVVALPRQGGRAEKKQGAGPRASEIDFWHHFRRVGQFCWLPSCS